MLELLLLLEVVVVLLWDEISCDVFLLLFSAGVEAAKGKELPNNELFGVDVVLLWDGVVGVVDCVCVGVFGVVVVVGATGWIDGGRRDLRVTSSQPNDLKRCSRCTASVVPHASEKRKIYS